MRKFRLKTLQASFVAGELSPEVFGRIDQDIYAKGAGQLRNVYVNPQGHLSRREGLQFIDSTTTNQAARLIEFKTDLDTKYLLVFTPGEFKVYKDDVLQATVTAAPISALTADQIAEINFTQSADTLILVHPDVQPIKILRVNDTTWTPSNIIFSNIPVFAYSGVTVSEPVAHVTPSSTTGRGVTITASPGVFNSGHVGQFIISKLGGVLFIKTFVSSSSVKGDVHVDFPNTSAIASGNWELETGYEDVWSNTRGWQVSVTFFQNRLWFGGSKGRKFSLWGSKSADFFNFDVGGGEPDEAIVVTANRTDPIRNIFAGRNLQIFTEGGEAYVPSEVGKPIIPETVILAETTLHGSSRVSPVSVDGTTLFLEESGKVVREFIFNDLEQSYTAKDISFLSSHLIRTPKAMAVRRSKGDSPSNFVYLVNTDGTMAVLSTLRDQELLAWTLFETNGSFEDVVTVGSDVYVTTKRTVNSSTVRYIEKLNSSHFMDASEIATNGSPITSWTGFGHLNNETVKVRGDDFILEDETISSGNFTSSLAVSKVEAGFNFAAKVETLPIDADLGGFTLSGDWRRIVWANMRLLLSRNIVVKFGNNTYKPAFVQFGSKVLDQPVQNFTGWKKVYLTGLDRDLAITITQEEPLEFNLLSMTIGVK